MGNDGNVLPVGSPPPPPVAALSVAQTSLLTSAAQTARDKALEAVEAIGKKATEIEDQGRAVPWGLVAAGVGAALVATVLGAAWLQRPRVTVVRAA